MKSKRCSSKINRIRQWSEEKRFFRANCDRMEKEKGLVEGESSGVGKVERNT